MITAPKIKSEYDIHFPEPEKEKLENGAEFVKFNIGTQNVVKVSLDFRISKDKTKVPYAAKLLNTLIGESSKQFKEGVIVEEIDFHGAFLESSYGTDVSNISLYCPTHKLKDVMPYFKSAINESIVPQRILDLEIARSVQSYKTGSMKVGTVSKRLFTKTLYKNHYYGVITELEDFNSIKKEDLINLYQEYYSSNNLTAILAGKFSKDEEDLVRDFLNTIQTGKEGLTRSALVPSDRTVIYNPVNDAIQSSIRLGSILDAKFGSKEYFALKVLNTTLGGYFGSRLMSNIREDKGYTYGVGSAVSPLLNGVSFSIATEVGADVTEDAINEIYKEVNKLQEIKVSADELQVVKNYMMGGLLRASDGVFSIVSQYKSVRFLDTDLSFFKKYADGIQSTTSDDILEAAQKHLKKETIVEIIAGAKS